MKDTFLSLIRHVATAIGGYLLAKGIISGDAASWLPGAVFILAGAIWGSIDEYLVTKQRIHLILSLVRHTLTAIGGYFAAIGTFSLESVETIIGILMTIAGAIWGAGDEFTYAAEHPPTE